MSGKMILILGMAHSHTSAIAKFLYDNGGNFSELTHNNSETLPYDKYEDQDVLNWVKERKRFRNTKFPVKDTFCKAPDAVYFLDHIPDIKIVFCMRHVGDLVSSNIDKNKGSVSKTLNRVLYQYDNALSATQDVYFVPTERILSGNVNEAKRLMEFCGLSGEPKFDLQPIKKKRTYLSFRLENFLWRLLNKFYSHPKEQACGTEENNLSYHKKLPKET